MINKATINAKEMPGTNYIYLCFFFILFNIFSNSVIIKYCLDTILHVQCKCLIFECQVSVGFFARGLYMSEALIYIYWLNKNLFQKALHGVKCNVTILNGQCWTLHFRFWMFVLNDWKL